MKKILSDYLKISNRFRREGLSKLERKQRHSELSEWEKKDYGNGSLTLCDIQNFWKDHNQICWNKLFISKVICPVIMADLEHEGFEGIRFLFYCFRGHERAYIYADSPLEIFCEFSGYKYQPLKLANLLLEHEPDNVDALNYKYHVLKEFLEFSIHEMPSGILNGMNGASASDIPSMLEDINEFECISKKLNMPSYETLIADCRRYYNAYEYYLQHTDKYKSFENYLRLNHIAYQSYTSHYDYK